MDKDAAARAFLRRALSNKKLAHLIPEGEDALKLEVIKDAIKAQDRYSIEVRGHHILEWVWFTNMAKTGWDDEQWTLTLDGAHATLVPNPLVDADAFVAKLITIPGLEPPSADEMGREEWVRKYGEVPACPLCRSPMREITTKDGNKFWGCRAYKDSGCKGALNVDDEEMWPPRCPSCTLPMRKREGRKGEFWGCTGYPDCSQTIDGPRGDELRTEVTDWMPEPGLVSAVHIDRDVPVFPPPEPEESLEDTRSSFRTSAAPPLAPPPPEPERGTTVEDFRNRFRRKT